MGGRIGQTRNGNKHLYTVEIPEDNGTNYLHWEKPLTREQIGRITEKLKSGGWNVVDGNHPTFEKNGERIVLNERAQGQDVYAELEEALGSDKVASEFLASIGFTGISYPAEALSGGRKDAARNFVIFNEKMHKSPTTSASSAPPVARLTALRLMVKFTLTHVLPLLKRPFTNTLTFGQT